MECLTWREFKELVERRLAELGKTEEVEIWFIDVSFPGKHDERGIQVTENLGLSVS